ncbi:MAG TPA: hypothetical protein VGY56_02480 [Verrucomicrobiae bacterium]|nr:hypothetical protein [Verrucomicrobiae bacterium]
MNYCDKSIVILCRTNDGNNLAPIHLKLVELAVNGWLSEQGEVAFEELYQSVLKGYTKPWHCGVEHVTKDHEGYIYWKGVRIEHFSFHSYDDVRKATEALGAACRHLEATNQSISFSNYSDAL